MNERERQDESAWRLSHAKLDAALVRSIRAPRLDGTFDHAVWGRIAAEQRAAVELPDRLARQLRADARVSLFNWVAGGIVAIGATIAFAVAAASSTSWASLSALTPSLAVPLGAVGLMFGLLALSPLRDLSRRFF